MRIGPGIGRLSATAWWILTALLSIAIAIFSYRYLPRLEPRNPAILANLFAHPWLDLHILGAATALLLGSFQFIAPLRARWAKGHRWIGRIYAISCIIGGAGGLVLALGSTAGPVATAGFGGLAVLWIAVNILGWRAALARRLAEHRRWMIRSWALTLAAVTLRLYLLALPLLDVAMIDGYRAIAFLCWIPNLIVAELYARDVFRWREPAVQA